jgi:hypothetical protein
MKTELFILWLCAQLATAIAFTVAWFTGADWFRQLDGTLDLSLVFITQFAGGIWWFLARGSR